MAPRSIPAYRYLASVVGCFFFAFAAWALQLRRTYAAYLGAAAVAFFGILGSLSAHGRAMVAVLRHGTSAYHSLPRPYLDYTSQRELQAAALLFLVSNLCIVALALYLVFSTRVRAFLAHKSPGAA